LKIAPTKQDWAEEKAQAVSLYGSIARIGIQASGRSVIPERQLKGRPRNTILIICPSAQINELAAFAAKWPKRVIFAINRGFATLGAFYVQHFLGFFCHNKNAARRGCSRKRSKYC
jgi:hypothetical protein